MKHKNNPNPLIFFSTAVLIYYSFMFFVGYALHDLLWNRGWSFIFIFHLGLIAFVSFVPLTFFAFFFNHKRQLVKPLNLVFIYASVLLIPIIALVTYRIQDTRQYNDYYTFTSQRWIRADDEERGRLIDSFRKLYPLVGETKMQVITLLGEADYEEEYSLSYMIGSYKQFIAIDPCMYHIVFDTNFIVISEAIFST